MLKILFIGLVWPEPTSSAAGWRILHLVKLLLQDYEVHFASAASKSPFSADLISLGVKEHEILLNDHSFDAFVKDLDPVAVVFDRFMVEEQYGWRVVEFCPNALRILDTEDLHFLRQARQEAFKKGVDVDLYSGMAKREIASITRSDVSLIISKSEIALLQEKFNVDKERLFYLPFQEEVLDEEQISQTPEFEQRANFVFIGNFIHEPNWKTVEVLKRSIWPVLRKKLPKAELHIYGAYASEKVLQLNNEKERFLIKGRADDARLKLKEYRVLLAPIPFGAGIKGKFVDAMWSGTPSVSSEIGAEDMCSAGLWNGFISDCESKFVEHASLLYQDKNCWELAQKNGFEIFNNQFANTDLSKQFLQWIDEARKDVEGLRNRNFIGQILLQQNLNATRYMALWIEAKNK